MHLEDCWPIVPKGMFSWISNVGHSKASIWHCFCLTDSWSIVTEELYEWFFCCNNYCSTQVLHEPWNIDHQPFCICFCYKFSFQSWNSWFQLISWHFWHTIARQCLHVDILAYWTVRVHQILFYVLVRYNRTHLNMLKSKKECPRVGYGYSYM